MSFSLAAREITESLTRQQRKFVKWAVVMISMIQRKAER